MSLRREMSYGDAIAYLRVQGDLWAMETDNMLTNLPYGRLRTVFSAVDVLAALYYGCDPGTQQRDIVKPRNSQRFLSEVFWEATTNERYRGSGTLLYQMFRNGLVHFNEPRRFEAPAGRCSTKMLTFTVLTGDLERSVATIDGQDFVAAHLSRIVIDDKTVLVISPVKFVADLQHALAYFEDQLREEEHTGGAVRLTFWNQTAELLERPELAPKYVTW